MSTKLAWTTAWIAGAGTDLSRELALQLARAGVKVAVSGTALEDAASLENAGAKVFSHGADDAAVALNAAAVIAHLGAVDLAVFAAPPEHAMDAASYSGVGAFKAMDASYNDVLRGLGTVMPAMIKRGSGHIALVASMAGYRGFTGTAADAPAKAALISLTEALRNDLARYGVTISVINPAPAESKRWRDLQAVAEVPISPADAATLIITQLRARRYEVAFPARSLLNMKLLRLMPNTLFFWLRRRRESRLG